MTQEVQIEWFYQTFRDGASEIRARVGPHLYFLAHDLAGGRSLYRFGSGRNHEVGYQNVRGVITKADSPFTKEWGEKCIRRDLQRMGTAGV